MNDVFDIEPVEARPELLRIKASAGAGKTFSLSIRYLFLLARYGPPSHEVLKGIIAITFTNKAAQEMRQRILGHLKAIALRKEGHEVLQDKTGLSPQEASAWIHIILNHFSDFQVRTVDSLLFSILRAFSFEAGLGPELNVVFRDRDFWEQVFDLLFSQVLDRTRPCFDKAVETYFTTDERGGFYPESGLRRRIYEILKKVEAHDSPLKGPEEMRQALEDAKKDLMAAYRDFLRHLNNISEGVSKTYLKMFSEGLGPREIVSKNLVFNQNMPKTFFKKKVKIDPIKKQTFLASLDKLRRRARDYLELLPACRIVGYVDLINELKILGGKKCESDGIILGSDHWTKLVSSIVNDPSRLPRVFLHLGHRFRDFLFDEFQDTSRTQWRALHPILEESLSLGGSLFMVGDIKQAIYGWRGGDMELFDQVLDPKEEGFFQVEDVYDMTIRENYRSHPCLVRFFNEFFSPLTDKDLVFNTIAKTTLGTNMPEGVKEWFAERVARGYKDHVQEPVTLAQDAPMTPKIVIREVQGQKDVSLEFIKLKFLEEIREEWSDREKGGPKKGVSAPIACLVRSHERGEIISQWLAQEGIPVVTENAFYLHASSLVKGIVCLFRLMLNRNDEVALNGLFSSGILPFGPKGQEEVARCWMEGAMEGWQRRLEGYLKDLLTTHWVRGPYCLLLELDSQLGISKRLPREFPNEGPYFERFKEIIHNFELKEGKGLRKFMDYWDRQGMDERIGLPAYMDAVQVLTIHKAKGLEFPVVFIPFTDWYLKERAPIKVIGDRLIFLGKGVHGRLKEVRGRIWASEVMENINLVYVAMTRATHRLYLNINTPSNSSGLGPISTAIKCLVDVIGRERLKAMEGVTWESHKLN